MQNMIKRRADYQSPRFSIPTTQLSIQLDPNDTLVTSTLEIERLGEHNEPLVLDGNELSLVSVKLNNELFTEYTENDNQLVIPTTEKTFSLTLVTQLNPSENKALEGLYLSNGMFCTQCEPEGFRRITYFIDRPDVLSVFTVTLTGDKQAQPYLLANGNPVERGENNDGTHWVTWHDPFPKPSYLFAVVAGQFDVIDDTFTTASGREVTIQFFVEEGKRARSIFALESLKRAMAWDEQVYGLEYDLDIYMVVSVDFFNMGAMENKGLNIFNSKYVLADQATATDTDFFNVESVIAHEYFHNWTGNRVTCRDWFQLSLKEGLTVFRDQKFSADMTSALSTRISQVKVIREHQFAEDASAMSHPIRPDEVMEMNNFYTVTVYDKGAEVIRMLHTLLGKDTYRKGIDVYFARHDGQAVTCDDFIAAMQSVTDIDLSQFALWYSQSGTPEITVTESYDEQQQEYALTLAQQTLPTADQSDKQSLFIPIGIECIDSEGRHLEPEGNTVNQGIFILRSDKGTLKYRTPTKPIANILTNFSAPVKVNQSVEMDELLHIFSYATDNFSRWNAVQSLYDGAIEKLYQGHDEHSLASMWPNLTKALEAEIDNFELLGECLSVPTFETLCQNRTDIDIVKLSQAQTRFCELYASELADTLVRIYHHSVAGEYCYNDEQIKMRKCKNAVLALLAHNTIAISLIETQYHQSDNMTDTLGALSAAKTASQTLFNQLMCNFENKWKHEPIVMDKWFGLHATNEQPDILSQITLLRQHPAFAADNPNRIRALIGSFAFYNTLGFHDISGAGYKYLTDYLLDIDATNPQVASRLVTPLMQFQKYNSTTQTQMRDQLARLLNHKTLSKDLFEKVSKALAYGK